MPDAEPLYAATLVVRRAVSKPDALAMVALVLDSAVERAGSARARVPVGEGAWAEVEIPKFGEPPPLAIDVYSTLSDDHARLHALRLAAVLDEQAGGDAVPDFPH